MKIVIDAGDLLTPEEAAKKLRISRMSVFRWIKRGKIIPIKLDRHTLIPKIEIIRLRKLQGKLQK